VFYIAESKFCPPLFRWFTYIF